MATIKAAVSKRGANRTWGHGLYKDRESYLRAKLAVIIDKEEKELAAVSCIDPATSRIFEIED